MIVEAEDVQFSEIEEVRTAGGLVVQIYGLVSHNAYVAYRVDRTRIDTDLILDVSLTPAKEGLSGRFKLEVPLGNDVKRILFGPERTQIWPTPENSRQPEPDFD